MNRSAFGCPLRITCAFGMLLALASCVATPLPDPPSVRPGAMSLTSTQPDLLQLAGTDGAIGDGVTRLRVTDSRTAEAGGRVETTVSAAGAFSAMLAGTLADTLYLEAVAPTGDTFVAAVALSGGVVVEVSAGADTDSDGSPDAVDCAPLDGSQMARDCEIGTPCVVDSECLPAEVCVAGSCRLRGCVPEICGNGIDDNCDGIIDDGC